MKPLLFLLLVWLDLSALGFLLLHAQSVVSPVYALTPYGVTLTATSGGKTLVCGTHPLWLYHDGHAPYQAAVTTNGHTVYYMQFKAGLAAFAHAR